MPLLSPTRKGVGSLCREAALRQTTYRMMLYAWDAIAVEIGAAGESLGEFVERATVVCVRDPFGNIVELAEIPDPKENPVELPGVKKLGDFGG